MKWKIALLLIFTVFLKTAAGQSALKDIKNLPSGFRSIHLGMQVDNVKNELLADPYFRYRGDPDVSLLPEPEQVLIRCSGNSYIKYGYFQFYKGKLFSIILEINRDKMDYYSVYTALTNKYGDPDSLSPQEAVWESINVRLSLEKPLTVKYLDEITFKNLKKKGKSKEKIENILRKDFLDQF